MLDIKHLSASHDTKIILQEINLTVARDDIVALIGPSGTGKTTLIECINGLQKITSGNITLNGTPVTPRQQTISWIPQQYGLLPWATVYDNVLMGVTIKKIPVTDLLKQQVSDLLQSLGLSELVNQFPNQLSGGQQQRVAIARAMLVNPDIFLLDEPFSALDALTREQMQAQFFSQWQIHKAPTILITHDVEEAVFLGSRIVLLSGSPGQIVADIPNDKLFHLALSERRGSSLFYEQVRLVREALGR